MSKLIYKYYPYPANVLITIFGSKCKTTNYDQDVLQSIIDQLDTREKEIIKYRYEDGMTYRQIGEELDMEDSRVSQLIHRCCNFIKVRYACYIIDNRVSIDALGLSSRCASVLKKNKVNTVYDLIGYNKKSLMDLNGIGEAMYKEIIHALVLQGINTRRFR